MRLTLLPREDKFFTFLNLGAENLKATAKKVLELMENYDTGNLPAMVEEITRLEHQGDEITHEIFRQLHKTFITPLDREDIAALAERIDDMVDALEEAVQDMLDYRIGSPTQKAKELATLVLEASQELKEAVSKLHYRGAQLQGISEHCKRINTLENQADQVFRSALAQLFSDGIPVIDIIKWREVYNQLEMAMDRSEDAADVLEAVVLKHA